MTAGGAGGHRLLKPERGALLANVALVYNMIQPNMLRDGPLDRMAEYDSKETISALSAALQAGGHEVILLEADEAIAEKLQSAHPQVVFHPSSNCFTKVPAWDFLTTRS